MAFRIIPNGDIFHIQPKQIDASKCFQNTNIGLNTTKTKNAAAAVIMLLQDAGKIIPLKLGALQPYLKKMDTTEYYLEQLLLGGWIVRSFEGEYFITAELLEMCFHYSPVNVISLPPAPRVAKRPILSSMSISSSSVA